MDNNVFSILSGSNNLMLVKILNDKINQPNSHITINNNNNNNQLDNAIKSIALLKLLSGR